VSGDTTTSSSDDGNGSGSVTTASTDTSTTMDLTTGDATGDPTGSTTGDPTGAAPNGATCTANLECESGMCFLAGILGGVCGECLVDADCRWGCSPPNALSDPPAGAYCSDGSIGGGCQSSDACQRGLVCKAIIDVPGVLTQLTCGECLDQIDCLAAQLCSPDIVITDFTGAWYCIDPGSKALGEFCDYSGTGDAECASGFCGIADIMSLLQFGVCSECVADGDCGAGTCEPPTVDLDGTVTPGTCV
jgi:hypothetical protein